MAKMIIGGKLVDLDEKLQQQEDDGGMIDTTKFKPGTKMIVETKNSTYSLTFTDPKEGDIILQGGTRWADPVKGWFSGSTFGGSMLLMKKASVGMYMELGEVNGSGVTTTSIQKIQIIEPSEEQTHTPS